MCADRHAHICSNMRADICVIAVGEHHLCGSCQSMLHARCMHTAWCPSNVAHARAGVFSWFRTESLKPSHTLPVGRRTHSGFAAAAAELFAAAATSTATVNRATAPRTSVWLVVRHTRAAGPACGTHVWPRVCGWTSVWPCGTGTTGGSSRSDCGVAWQLLVLAGSGISRPTIPPARVHAEPALFWSLNLRRERPCTKRRYGKAGRPCARGVAPIYVDIFLKNKESIRSMASPL